MGSIDFEKIQELKNEIIELAKNEDGLMSREPDGSYNVALEIAFIPHRAARMIPVRLWARSSRLPSTSPRNHAIYRLPAPPA